MVARMSWPLAVETVLDEGPMSSNPSADWMKVLVAPESNMASLMVLSKSCLSARRASFIAFLFSIRRAQCCVTFERGRGLSADSTINRAFKNTLLVGSGGSVVGGEMGPAVTR